MKTVLGLVRDNIKALLEAQHKNQGALAFALNRDRSWINKILNGKRGLGIEELDHIADFFHIEPYQLLQPGIHQRTERRSGTDRRGGQDRREAEALKVMKELRARLKMADHGINTSSGVSTLRGDDGNGSQEAFVARLQREVVAATELLRNLARVPEQIRQDLDHISTARNPLTPTVLRSRRPRANSDSSPSKR
jgi:transcriptional regulator with XRE-family HTH domain